MKNRSCLANLLFFFNEFTRRLYEAEQVEVSYHDFSKASFSVNFTLFLIKLVVWFPGADISVGEGLSYQDR